VANASKRGLLYGKLNPNSPWIRCIIGPIVAACRPTPPARRGSVTRATVLLKGRQSAPRPLTKG